MINFFRNPFFLPWIYPQLTWRIPATSKELYLTFDDGPVPGPTEFVLDTLSKHTIKSTFFCIGDNIKKHPELFTKIVSAGHVIGNHTFNHLSGWKTETNAYVENVALCEQEIHSKTKTGKLQDASYKDAYLHFSLSAGSGARELFRPPYGRITRDQIKSLSDYKIVMWDVLTHDYSKTLSRKNCLSGAISAARPGSIVVFHDSLKAEKNMTYVLPRFIEHFVNAGYTFKTLI